ncbi:hypothetical protein N9L68_01625 [bacterium]|nr:hypothetical protein [bacterium]
MAQEEEPSDAQVPPPLTDPESEEEIPPPPAVRRWIRNASHWSRAESRRARRARRATSGDVLPDSATESTPPERGGLFQECSAASLNACQEQAP